MWKLITFFTVVGQVACILVVFFRYLSEHKVQPRLMGVLSRSLPLHNQKHNIIKLFANEARVELLYLCVPSGSWNFCMQLFGGNDLLAGFVELYEFVFIISSGVYVFLGSNLCCKKLDLGLKHYITLVTEHFWEVDNLIHYTYNVKSKSHMGIV